MPKRYEQLKKLVAFVKPKVIVEVGTHNGLRARMMCEEARKYNANVHYIGYDLFDEADAETNEREMNGKGAGSQTLAMENLKIDGVTSEFHKGDTRKTLHGQDVRADFVFIDGGHSVDTIRGDYEALKHSRMIALDDYYSGDFDTNKFGCNKLLEGIPHELLPIEEKTNHKGVKVKIAVVGYSSKWADAVRKVMSTDGHKDVLFWRGEDGPKSDIVVCANYLETQIDIDAALEKLKKHVRKRLFFVVREDAFRTLAWWRKKLGEYFQLLEWMEPPEVGEACGQGMPLAVVGEWQSRGVLDDDRRFDQTAENVKLVAKRVRTGDEKNGRSATIVCYGPSLLQSWPEVEAERKYFNRDIFSVSGSHDFLVRRGVVPDFHVECDPRVHKASNLNNPQEGTKYLIASCCHPDLVKKLLPFDVSLWHLCNGQESFRILEELESEKGENLITGGGSVGLRALALGYAMGYREFHIYGMDCSFSSGYENPKELDSYKERQWAGPHKGKLQRVINVKCGDLWYKTSPVLVTYTRHFFDTVQRAPDAAFYLRGDGLLQHMAKLSMEENKPEAA